MPSRLSVEFTQWIDLDVRDEMKYLTILAVVLVFAALFGSGLARSVPVCGYTNSVGKQIFLQYYSYSGKGDEYTDLGADGKCLKKVTCLSDYNIKVEE